MQQRHEKELMDRFGLGNKQDIVNCFAYIGQFIDILEAEHKLPIARRLLESLTEQELRDRLDELERERKATMVLLRATRALNSGEKPCT